MWKANMGNMGALDNNSIAANYGGGEVTSSSGNTLKDLATLVLNKLPETNQAQVKAAAITSMEQNGILANQQLGLKGINVYALA
jgi:hypothetical protein